MKFMNQIRKYGPAVVLFAAANARAADFTDTDAAITAVGGHLTTGQTKFLAALTIGVGVFGVGIIIRLVRKGLKVG